MKVTCSEKLVYLLPLLLVFSISPAYAQLSSSISSSYYEFGDKLEFRVNIDTEQAKDLIKVEIDNGETKKTYGASTNWGSIQIGIPLIEEKGFTSGVYDITFSFDGESQTHQFGLETFPEKFTLYGQRNIYTLNDYAFFFGQVQGFELKDFSYSSNLLVHILDSDGNIVEDNWKSNKSTARSENDQSATKSIFRITLNTVDITWHGETQEEKETFEQNNIPLWDNGYRIQFKVDPITYQAGEMYTVKVQYQDLVREYDFYVVDNPYFPIQP